MSVYLIQKWTHWSSLSIWKLSLAKPCASTALNKTFKVSGSNS